MPQHTGLAVSLLLLRFATTDLCHNKHTSRPVKAFKIQYTPWSKAPLKKLTVT